MKIFFNGLRSGFPSKSHFKSHFLLLTLRDGVVFKLQNEVEKLRHDIDELKKNQNLRKIVNSRPDAPR
ncbi:hypothetical protein RIR_jg2201.t1 [Rhizophagus irregularis DAOM 181602=DAOM 197198]|nr:hypothetical protein RIR_jg2201.t1 [Rhizophagus irregularis DAOM 181602=DAOM 197198]